MPEKSAPNVFSDPKLEAHIFQEFASAQSAQDIDKIWQELGQLRTREGETAFKSDLNSLNEDLHKKHILPYFLVIEENPAVPQNFDMRNLASPLAPPPVPPRMEPTPASGNYQGSGTGQDGTADGGDGNGAAGGDAAAGDPSAISDPGGSSWDGSASGDMNVTEQAQNDLGQQLWQETPWAADCKGGDEGCAASVSKVLQQCGILQHEGIAGSANLDELMQQLTVNAKEKWTVSHSIDSARPGDILIGENSKTGHIGIVGVDKGQLVVYNNWSHDGKWHEEPLKSSYIATTFPSGISVLHAPRSSNVSNTASANGKS
ncbi:MAG: hypothetical protein ACRD3W_22565 [Terriglobales bacterium]